MFIILLAIAATLLALSALGFGGRFNLLAAGLCIWVITIILRTKGLV